MKKARLFAWMGLCFSLIAIVAVTWWTFHEMRHAAFVRHQAWVDRTTEQLHALQAEAREAVANWTLSRRPNLRELLSAHHDAAALYFNDTQVHQEYSVQREPIGREMAQMDPRLVALSLESLHQQKVMLGPLLVRGPSLYIPVARPVDEYRVLVAVIRSDDVVGVLEREARFWRFQVLVADRAGKTIFARGALEGVTPLLSRILARAAEGEREDWLPFEGMQAWQRAATFHFDPATDWVFVLSEPFVLPGLPLILFLVCLVAALTLGVRPLQAAAELERVGRKQSLENTAIALDRFMRGKDSILEDPRGDMEPLLPVVHTLRWLMPQWKRAESFPRELALERKLLSLLIESLPEGILFFNAQGALQLGNELGKVFLTLQQEAGRDVKIVSGMQIPRGFLEPYLSPVFTAEQKTLGKEVEVSWADGKHLYRIWVEAVQTTEEHLDGFIVVIRDITFRKQWEYVQEQVLSGITHDLRGPLSAVMGYLDLMKRQVKEAETPKLAEYIRLAREGATRLSQMVSDILDVVRFEQGKIELEPQPIAVDQLFKRLETTFGVNATQKNVELKFVGGEGGTSFVVSGDPKLLDRVFDNLIGNAIKFTPAHGTITVTGERQAGRAFFTVSDTGRGIPKEAQSRIFDKFQQVRPGDRAGGYGLGLAVAKFIVEAHKGEIHVESEVGKGSTFTFYIPDQEPAMRSVTPEAGAGPLPTL